METALGRDPGAGSWHSPGAESLQAEPLGTAPVPAPAQGVEPSGRGGGSGRSFWKVPWAPGRDERRAVCTLVWAPLCAQTPRVTSLPTSWSLGHRPGGKVRGCRRHGPRRPRPNLPPLGVCVRSEPLAVLVLVGSPRSPISCRSALPKSPQQVFRRSLGEQ